MSKRVLLWSKRGTLSLCTLGIVVSVYALYVEIIAERVEGYTALCDIGHRMSCSRVLTSRFGCFLFCNFSMLNACGILNFNLKDHSLFKKKKNFGKNSKRLHFTMLIILIQIVETLFYRWGRGFGLVDKVLSKDSILNQPNSIYGLAFYFFQATLGKYPLFCRHCY